MFVYLYVCGCGYCFGSWVYFLLSLSPDWDFSIEYCELNNRGVSRSTNAF